MIPQSSRDLNQKNTNPAITSLQSVIPQPAMLKITGLPHSYVKTTERDDPSKLRFENKKSPLTYSSELDLT